MIKFFWLVIYVLFAAVALRLLRVAAFRNGFKAALKDCGFHFPIKPSYRVELYKWIACDDEDICKDCRGRASWLAMDIEDWMKA